MNKIISVVVGVVVIGGVGAVVYLQSQKDMQTSSGYGDQSASVQGENAERGPDMDNDGDEGAAVSTGTAVSAQTSKSITMAEVQMHADASSCWSVVDGGVYDLTSWISKHPGGQQAILSICGKDGSTAFHNQHDHAPKQENILATMKIGVLTQ